MATTKKYWQSFDELAETPTAQKLAQNEFAEEIPVEEFLGDENALSNSSTSRRDFLKYLGFTTAAATLAACESPVVESIPYVVKPDSVTPGVPNYYASTYYDGHDFASVLVKTREGRPIKMEPNDMAAFNGGTNARVQASVLSLYDSARLREPMMNKGEEASWSDVLNSLKAELTKADQSGKEVVLLTSTIISPATRQLIEEFAAQYTNFRHVTYDPVSYSSKLDVWSTIMGVRALPTYKVENADLIVGVGADFLSGYTGQDMSKEYAGRRTPGEHMNRHIQIETQLSLTGANADKRLKVKSSEQGAVLLHLYNTVASKMGQPTLAASALSAELKTSVEGVAAELVKKAGKSLVLAGNNNFAQEALAAGINMMLGNFGATVDTTTPVYLRAGNDAEVASVLANMNAGKVGAIMTWGVNPAYSLNGFAGALEKVATTAAFADRLDETASLCGYALPVNHQLESWGDYMPTSNTYTLAQPTIRPLFNSKQGEEILLALMGSNDSFLSYLKGNFANSVQMAAPMLAWNKVLHDGSVEIPNTFAGGEMGTIDFASAASAVNKEVKSAGAMEIFFYQKEGMGSGVQANNPWLHELPDPISRISWDNYATVSQADAAAMGLETSTNSAGAYNGKTITLTVDGKELTNVPVFVQPGQASGTIGLAVGFGREKAGKAANGLGVNAYVLMGDDHYATDVAVSAISDDHVHGFASVQLAHTMMGRKVVNETTLADFMTKAPSEWNEIPMFETFEGKKGVDKVTLWEDHDHETGHMWNMSMDLNKCLGCGACVVACHLENNVPVVGKDEVRRHRDMHWLRIDRYYSSEDTFEGDIEKKDGFSGLFGENGTLSGYGELEVAAENPQVAFQPVMCQHCNHAPCETVCPVGATAHSKEGLNHMAYNRCIGTRYCANNCPYKVRRFNWFNYQGNERKFGDVNPALDEYGKMVLNPDVTVRARGVMEKCSLCIQRIQYNKLEAKKAGKPIEDGQFTTACAQACGTGAFVFGDVNDKHSEVYAAKRDPRAYHLLEEIGTQPSVFYQTKVRNTKEA